MRIFDLCQRSVFTLAKTEFYIFFPSYSLASQRFSNSFQFIFWNLFPHHCLPGQGEPPELLSKCVDCSEAWSSKWCHQRQVWGSQVPMHGPQFLCLCAEVEARDCHPQERIGLVSHTLANTMCYYPTYQNLIRKQYLFSLYFLITNEHTFIYR